MVGSDSSTGGFLAPSPAPAPLEGAALLSFIQGWVVGLCGLPGSLVRPRWQPEPPDIPQQGTAWASIGVQQRASDEFPQVVHHDDGVDPPCDELQRHEALDVLCSFYDAGSGGQADALAAQARDGTAIAQNREPLFNAGFGLISCGPVVPVPSLLKQVWLYRVDLPIGLRRVVVRRYPILSVASLDGSLATDVPPTTTQLTAKP